MSKLRLAALAGLSALALSGCISSGSKMDLAPRSVRPAAAPFADGDYCMLEGDKPPFTVRSEDQCMTFAWDAKARRYDVSGVDDDGTKIRFQIAAAPFRDGLTLFQLDSKSVRYDPPKEDKDEDTPPYLQSVGVVRGGAGALVAWDFTADELSAIVQRHPKLRIEGRGASREIAAGPRAEAMAYLGDLAAISLKGKDLKGVALYVRDKAGAADHPLAEAQAGDVDAAIEVLKGLAQR